MAFAFLASRSCPDQLSRRPRFPAEAARPVGALLARQNRRPRDRHNRYDLAPGGGAVMLKGGSNMGRVVVGRTNKVPRSSTFGLTKSSRWSTS